MKNLMIDIFDQEIIDKHFSWYNKPVISRFLRKYLLILSISMTRLG